MQKSGLRIIVISLFFLATLSNNAAAQKTLSLNEAIQTALKNSYDIQLVENNLAIAKNNNNIGVAGGLPTITNTSTNNNTLTTINQTFPDATRNTSRKGVDGSTLNSAVNATMVLFNGYKVQATKNRLESLERQNKSLLESQLLNTISTVMQQYYNVVRQQAFLKTIQKSIETSKQRLDIVETRQKIGVANQADFLQSNLDLNALIQAEQNQLLIIDQAKADLLNTIVMPNTTSVIINDSIKVDDQLVLSAVEAKIKEYPLLQSAQQLVNVNQFLEKETRSLTYPTLRASTGFNYNSNKSAAGFILLNESYGPFLGLNLSIPIYSGGANKRAIKNAEINTKSAKIQLQNTEQDLTTELFKTYQSYKNSLKQTPIEIQNFEMSQSLLDLVMQKYKLGQATMVDVKQAQQSFETAGFRLVSLRFNAKIAEIELKRLSNQLNF
ncbi:MAG: TolC family protein [Bacteroidetes bacterium]|jgi:outer membrane protein TolC|nr:TolC family protein [Bacteroidota bacterium]